ncbi:dTDP-4-dehydrorhamnose 3,5-epimerase, partial [Campylobacter jejuni]|nr:dTDP-4-dehydrorhamnose 3,5-epimerase [Campylobacter jejuni]
ETAVYYYKCAYLGEYMDTPDQFTYAWNDERIGIDWPTNSPILQSVILAMSRDK